MADSPVQLEIVRAIVVDRFVSLAKEVLVGGSAPPSIPRPFDARNEAAQEFLDSQFYLETTLSFEAFC